MSLRIVNSGDQPRCCHPESAWPDEGSAFGRWASEKADSSSSRPEGANNALDGTPRNDTILVSGSLAK